MYVADRDLTSISSLPRRTLVNISSWRRTACLSGRPPSETATNTPRKITPLVTISQVQFMGCNVASVTIM